MAEQVRCPTCRGQKKMNGIGGIPRDCWTCKATGSIEKEVPKLATIPENEILTVAIPTPLKISVPTDLQEMINPPEYKTELCSLEDIFPGVTQGVKEAEAKKKEVEAASQNPVKKAIFEGYSDALMEALLDEPKMPLIDWKKKHMRNAELFVLGKDSRGNDVIGTELLDLHLRNSIRLMYAQSKPIAPRKVNTMAAQDMVAKKDPDYVKYEREQKAKAENEARKAAQNV